MKAARKPLFAGNHVGVPDNFKTPRDVSIDVKTVVCPICKAELGTRCVSKTGKAGAHRARRRMAIRKLLREKS
jgi:hypothetical protein